MLLTSLWGARLAGYDLPIGASQGRALVIVFLWLGAGLLVHTTYPEMLSTHIWGSNFYLVRGFSPLSKVHHVTGLN